MGRAIKTRRVGKREVEWMGGYEGWGEEEEREEGGEEMHERRLRRRVLEGVLLGMA